MEDMNGKVFEVVVKNPNGDELKVTTSWDATIDDWQNIFSTILNWCTFHPDTIDDMFHQEKED